MRCAYLVFTAAALVALMSSTIANARVLTEVVNNKAVDANFKNTFAQGRDNVADQNVQVFAPDPSSRLSPEEEAVEVTAADFQPMMLDRNNPTCTLGDRTNYTHFSITDNKQIGRDARRGKIFNFYVQPGLEIRPVIIVALESEERRGKLEVSGDGVDKQEIKVDRDLRVRTFCGTWAWNADGRYELDVETDDVVVVARYFARRRGQKLGAFTQDSAVNIGLQVETTVAGNDKLLDTDTNVRGETRPGKLVMTLSNRVGDNEEKPIVGGGGGFDWASLGFGG
eukprot:CAMPEP_0177613804 /NCGR_PEP_ID=MMETSP0419_2-20121207/22237_1 /TAXON_ID=582737 /ORGANISM="Tetraselmis sp., Strain GSL018" /LENGTH=281 /DNA_ID=CAMNT_0019110659 /DNA_START=514 /DNA_END=1359 /DNA_ORIENTATION=-